ncbi:MAG: MotA/TolQ/ExbB proton channel family protein [Bdellovibrionales bacterium]
MEGFIKIVTEGGVAIWAILALGGFGLVVTAERVKALYFTFSMNSHEFLNKIGGYIKSDNIEEAISFAAAHEKAPMGHITKSVLSRANRDDQSIQQALDISFSEVIPKITKRMGYLTMVSNVATLIGLLGTIQGLIMSFEAVSFADPSQKQTLLAQGISTSMNTTAFGLAVAIPIMVIYSFLHSKQSSIMEDVTESSSKLIDLLSHRSYQGFDADAVYHPQANSAPESSGDVNTPPTNKVS